MADGLNKVMLLGNLGQDPELKTIAGGQAVLNLRLATTESYLDRNNARQERTDWHTVVIWGKRAEALSKFLAKGSQIFVEGRIQTRSYEKNGEKRYATDIVANNIILLGRRGGGAEAGEYSGGGGERRPQAGGGGGGGRAPSAPAPAAGGAGGGENYEGFADDPGGEDEIPF